MDNKTLINKLNLEIKNKLSSIVEGKTILTDLPYHGNIGDILIWQGELEFLNSINSYPLSQTSNTTFDFPKLESNITICLHGGGNFGDLYRDSQEFRKKIIINYPSNKILIFPQSTWYNNQSLIEEDAEIFAKHQNLYICARDNASFEFLKKNFFRNNIILVPDMAFFIGPIAKDFVINPNSSLFLKRLDKEAINIKWEIPSISSIRDWPGFEPRLSKIRCFLALNRFIKKLIFQKLARIYNKSIDKIMLSYFRKSLIKDGISILSPYEKIYTTRLHAMILGILLDKHVIVLDNKTHKLSDFYNTWLTNNSQISLRAEE